MSIFDLAVVHAIWILVPPLACIAGFLAFAARSRLSEQRVLTVAVIVLASVEAVAAVGGFVFFAGTRVSSVEYLNATAREIAISSGTREASRVQPGSSGSLVAIGRICSVVITTDTPAVEVVVSAHKCNLGGQTIRVTSHDRVVP